MLKKFFKADQDDFTLYGVPVSPYVRKVLVVLYEKEITFKHEEVLPKVLLEATGQVVPSGFEKTSILGRIPALEHGDFTISDSSVISNYLENYFKDSESLYPRTPDEYAMVLFFENYADHVFSRVVYEKIFLEAFVKPNVLGVDVNKDLVETALQDELPEYLSFLESQLVGKTFLVGDNFSIADVAIATHFISLKLIGYELDAAQYPNLFRYVNDVLSRESFKKAIKGLF